MHLGRSIIAALLCAALVAGCGGGGGGAGAGSPVATAPVDNGIPQVTPGGTWLTFSPGTVSLSTYAGESAAFEVKALSSRTFEKPFNAAIIDSKGVVSSQVSLLRHSDLSYALVLRTAAMSEGVHTTYLQVRLCEDDPRFCNKPLPGSPWHIPVTVTVASAAQAKERMTVPAAIALVTYEDEPVSFQLDAQLNSTFDVPVSFGIVDSAGLVAPEAKIVRINENRYNAEMRTASGLKAGVHATSLEVRLCYDDPRECKSPVTGSPWRVPTTVTVKPASNLTPLSAIAGLAPWSTYNGNPLHNAYVPAHFDPAGFNRRWTRLETRPGNVDGTAEPGSAVQMSAPVIDKGRVFVAFGRYPGNAELLAFGEADANPLWRHDLGRQTFVTAPAVGNGKVVITSASPEGRCLWVFDQASGRLLSKTPLQLHWSSGPAPTVVGDMVYAENGTGGDGLVKFNAATHQVEWRSKAMAVSGWTPSVDDSYAWIYQGNILYALDLAHGGIAFSILEEGVNWVLEGTTSPVMNERMAIITLDRRLVAFDLRTRARAWVGQGASFGHPVLAQDTVYTFGANGSAVEARAASTGLLQWTAPLPANAPPSQSGMWFDSAYADMVVTSNLLFASSGSRTVALDLATREVVWTYPFGGELAISEQGVLYIVSPGGRLVAINLR